MGWERKRGKLHELDLLLRGDADTTFLPPDTPLPDDNHLRHDARRRHAHDARCGHASCRQDVASAQPAARRPQDRPRGARLRRPAAARHGIADHRRRGVVLPARLLGPSRPRPIRVRRLRPLPGRLRRRHLHRQGDVPHRRDGGGAEGPHRREPGAEPRPARGGAGARRARHRRRAGRGLPDALRRRRLAPASLGARRLAAASLHPRAARADSVARALEDDRQSAPHADADRLGHRLGRRLDGAALRPRRAVPGAC